MPAAAEGDYKHKIVQRGAVPPLIDMLANEDNQLREMAAFALGRLAQVRREQRGGAAGGQGWWAGLALLPAGLRSSRLATACPPSPSSPCLHRPPPPQNADNQAGIVAQGGLSPLLDLLETCQSNLQVRAGAWAGLDVGGSSLPVPCSRLPR